MSLKYSVSSLKFRNSRNWCLSALNSFGSNQDLMKIRFVFISTEIEKFDGGSGFSEKSVNKSGLIKSEVSHGELCIPMMQYAKRFLP